MMDFDTSFPTYYWHVCQSVGEELLCIVLQASNKTYYSYLLMYPVLVAHRGAMNMDIKPVLADFVYFLLS